MSELVDNVLDMARLETGAVHVNRQWHPLDEVVGSGAVTGCASGSKGGASTCNLAGGPAAGPARRVLIGASAHATCSTTRLKYTPAGHADRDRRRDRRRRACGSAWRIDGPGLRRRRGASACSSKFYRARPESRPGRRGAGAVDLPRHRGGARRVASGPRIGPTGGARFCFILPRRVQPPAMQPETLTAARPA